jgi:hypothetical protein
MLAEVDLLVRKLEVAICHSVSRCTTPDDPALTSPDATAALALNKESDASCSSGLPRVPPTTTVDFSSCASSAAGDCAGVAVKGGSLCSLTPMVTATMSISPESCASSNYVPPDDDNKNAKFALDVENESFSCHSCGGVLSGSWFVASERTVLPTNSTLLFQPQSFVD